MEPTVVVVVVVHFWAFIHVTCIHPLQSLHSLTHSHFFAWSFLNITHNNAGNPTPLIIGTLVHPTNVYRIQYSFNQRVCVCVCVCTGYSILSTKVVCVRVHACMCTHACMYVCKCMNTCVHVKPQFLVYFCRSFPGQSCFHCCCYFNPCMHTIPCLKQ